ncbi:MAG: VCBS repeat-containing protein [Gemmatimonadaceae bacterium]
MIRLFVFSSWRLAPALCFFAGLLSCTGAHESADVPLASAPAAGTELFSRLPANVTGVRFENTLTETQELNVFTYRNYYNGGGVAIADLNGDGVPEIILASNSGGPRVYLNKGNFHFRDVTDVAGVKTRKGSWSTGVAIADVNGDGRLDIYICHAGPGTPAQRANELWINQGLNADSIPTFKEMAAEYGVTDGGYSTQAVFVDYDRDGDLDLFLIRNSPRAVSSFGLRNMRNVPDTNGGARLYRNDGGHFTDVSAAAGIHSPEAAFGLGVVVADVNNDGWPDIYVANDFFERDYLYINAKNGTFTDSLDAQVAVASYFSMGLDIADVDNDGWPDIYTTDMLPEDENRLKMTAQFEGWDAYQTKVKNGYGHQSMRNMLQRNNRDGTFTDIAWMAGVARTDWSWSALIADLDLDGHKDIFVANGLAKDITSQDFIAYLASDETMKSVTSGGKSKADFLKLTKAMSTTRLSNYAFHNTGNMQFTNESVAWGLSTPSISSGAAYGDLDGDGAPDLVVNNVNQEAFIYRNNARALRPENHFLKVKLEGEQKNRFGVGARASVFAGGSTFMQEESPTRGFQSSVDYVLDFGIGKSDVIDSLRVVWPDGRVSVKQHLPANQLVTVRQAEATLPGATSPLKAIATLLVDVTDRAVLGFKHQENEFIDFERERLMPKLVSTEGPMMAVADVNGDGLDDIFIGGAKGQVSQLLMQQSNGTFLRSNAGVFEPDSISEDLGAVFFDANRDGHLDLYVVSGGNEYSEGASALQDRLYLGDGRGHFRKAPEGSLPAESSSGSRVVAADYDGDGAIDLFVGGRVTPWRYGTDPQSMLLKNDGKGHFTNVTATLAPELEHIGMVTDAVWRDVDGDGRLDLVVVGEWMPITIFRNAGGGKLKKLEVRGLEKSNGWWNRIVAADVDGDGRVDFVVGNLGLNGRLHASEREPAEMFVKDFDGNGSVEQIITQYNGGVSYPITLRDELLKTLPYLAPRYTGYKAFAKQAVTDIFSVKELADAGRKTAYDFATSLVHNNGDGSFTLVPLPAEAQLAPVYGILATDVDRDGHTDLLIAGNFDGFRPELGRMASSEGLLLHGDGKGAFTPVRSPESGFHVPGQSRDIQRVRTAAGELIVVARNNDGPLVFRSVRPPGLARATGTNR